MKPWLEMELASQFRPVMAPEGLWDRLQSESVPVAVGRAPKRRPQQLVLAALATAVLLLSASFAWQVRSHLRDLTQLTDQDLRAVSDASKGTAFPSDDPAQIRKWLKAKGNIEIALPSDRNDQVRLLGAKLVDLRGTLIATVAYHVGTEDDSATLLVCRKKSSFWNRVPWNTQTESKHLFTRVVTSRGTSLFAWSTKDQNYAVASTGQSDSRGACLLCHADSHARL
jgi:hypothetical protein